MKKTYLVGSTRFEDGRRETVIPKDFLNEKNKTVEVMIQGERISIPRGKKVNINPIVTDILNETDDIVNKVNTSNDELVVLED